MKTPTSTHHFLSLPLPLVNGPAHLDICWFLLHNMLLEHDEYDDWRNLAVVLEEDSANVKSFGSIANIHGSVSLYPHVVYH
jgi:hypothetical protein